MPRPCENKHRDPAEHRHRCPLCEAYLTRPDLRALWDAGRAKVWGDPPTGRSQMVVQFCASRGVWDWTITLDGIVTDRGTEATREAAEAAADESRMG